ncbi:MAG: hypothetical protein B6D65_02715 [candidate division Zixibacteria bacterium 4484_93]|nr:MAG: hypothetical protein B6D65_02715 [candidate division Zixibacteria bacterium 4484_93]RKZ34944.1 MAG: hypothetical protein DRQ19_00070 [bacterium]
MLYTAERVYLLSREEIIVRKSRRLSELQDIRSSLEESVEQLKSRERIKGIAERDFHLSDVRIEQVVHRERKATAPVDKLSLFARIKSSFKRAVSFVFEREKLKGIWEI